MQYQLNISIDANGLQMIYASGQSVTIVKSVVSNPLPGGTLPVAWTVFQPLEENAVSWTDSYSIYATTTQIMAGAMIVQTSMTPASVQTGWTYTFSNGQFTGAQGGVSDAFNMSNQQGGMFNFGLSQQAVVNNVMTMAPLNAIPVLQNQVASFTPIQTISVFLSNASNSGTVLGQVPYNALTFSLSSQVAANIGFNDASNSFYLLSGALMSSHAYAQRPRSSVAKASQS